MKKFLLTLFIVACFALCVIPSLGMLAFASNETIGNERETKLPTITNDDGALNTSYPTELGDYFKKHFAFRPFAITTDVKIQSSVFQTSNNDSVIVGTDGWLYYSSTLDNYQGKNVFSDRKAKSLVHNLDIIQRFTQSHGAEFIFAIAPNKNTLYPEHMPYYDKAKLSADSNRDKVTAALKDSEVNYCDLFSLFEAQDKVLYFKQDSHWNNEGALMAYDAILSQLGKSHDDYSSAESIRKKDFTGDLAKMLFPSGSEPEYNTYYGAESRYSYVTDTESVEDAFIKTESENGAGSLYMYRDSFGNSLLPYFASAYQTAAFTKSFPMLLENDFEDNSPDTFVMELVERNLDWLITRPPIISAPSLSYLKTDGKLDGEVTSEIKECEYAPAYTEISGSVSYENPQDDAVFYVSVTDTQGNTNIYEAFSTCTEESDNSFTAYLPNELLPPDSDVDIHVIAKIDNNFYQIGE